LKKHYYVYIITNRGDSVLYTGVTNNLKKRTYAHKEKLVSGFTKRYNVDKLVYYEVFNDIKNAITREKQIKSGSRHKKITLIEGNNPEWRDIYPEL
jgi:putative endonuclease